MIYSRLKATTGRMLAITVVSVLLCTSIFASLSSVHPESRMKRSGGSSPETRNFPQGQGEQGITRRRAFGASHKQTRGSTQKLRTRAVPGRKLSEGWQSLVSGDQSPAQLEKIFKAELGTNPKNAEATVGLTYVQEIRGEREQSLVTALEGLRNNPGSPMAFLLEDFLGNDATFNDVTTTLVRDSLASFDRDRAMDPLVRLVLRWFAYNLALRSGDQVRRRSAFKNTGFVPGAYFSAPETTLTRLAFLKSESVEHGHLKDIKWNYSSLDGTLARPPLYRMWNEGESNYYILLPFEVDRREEALLYFNTDSSFKVILDDRQLAENNIFDSQACPTRLRKVLLRRGRHRLLVKLHAGSTGAGIHIALLTTEGEPLKVHWLTTGKTPPGGRTAGFKDEKSAIVSPLKKLSVNGPEREGLEGLWLRWLGDDARGRLKLEDASRKTPKGLLWNYLVARAYLFESGDLPSKIAESRAESAVDRVLKVAPKAPMILYFQAFLKGDNSDSDQNLVILKKLTRNVPSDPRWFLTLARLEDNLGWDGQARKVLEEASAYHPECASVEYGWIRLLQGIGDRNGEKRAIQRLQKLKDDSGEWETYYRETHDWHALKTLLNKELRRNGDRDLVYDYKLADVAMRTGNYSEARRRFKKLVKLEPRSKTIALLLARACFLQGDDKAGFDAWKALKKRIPSAFKVDLARILLGAPLPFQDRRLSLATVLREDTAKKPDMAPSSLLLDQMAIRIEPDGSSIERYHGIVRINDKAGVNKEGEQNLPGQIVLLVRTIKPDGRILEPEQITEKKTASMPGLEPGDLIEYEYITFKPPNPVKPKSYLAEQVYLFQDIDRPFHRTELYMEYPKSFSMRFIEEHLPSPGKRGINGNLAWVDWKYRNMPRLPREPNTPGSLFYTPYTEAVGGVTWKNLALYFKNGIKGAFQTTPELEKDYYEAVHGAKTNNDKLKKIISYSMGRIQGEGTASWRNPTESLLTGRGSRIPVVCAFLKLAHIPFNILLAQPVTENRDAPGFPRLSKFHVPILEVKTGAKTPARFFTLTSPYRTPGILPLSLQGARALSLLSTTPWKEVTTPVDTGPWQKAKTYGTRTILPNGDARIEYRSTLDPDTSQSLRSMLKKLNKDHIKKAMQNGLSRKFGNIAIEKLKFKNETDLANPLEWDFTILVHGYGSVAGGVVTIPDPLPALRLVRAFASLNKRTLPLTTGSPFYTDEEITIVLPPGARTDYTLPSLTIESPFGRYSLTEKKGGGRIVIHRKFALPYQVIQPDRYSAFAAFLQKIDSTESGQMTIEIKQ